MAIISGLPETEVSKTEGFCELQDTIGERNLDWYLMSFLLVFCPGLFETQIQGLNLANLDSQQLSFLIGSQETFII